MEKNCRPSTIGAFLKGVGIVKAELDDNNYLIIYLSNGETHNAGQVPACDDILDYDSERPVKNRTLYSAIKSLQAETKGLRDNKVDKVDGKGLSTEDFSTLLKVKLEGLENYDDSSLQAKIHTIESRVNALIGTSSSTAIDNFNEIVGFLKNIEDSTTLDGIIAGIGRQLAGKVEKVEGKGLSTNDFTDEYKDKLDKIEGGGDAIRADGIYPQMSVGFAENLVGDGQYTSEMFGFRATAGEDRNVADTEYEYDQRSNGGARIVTLKGNSIVWNQMVSSTTTTVTLLANRTYMTIVGGTPTLRTPTQDTTLSVSSSDKVYDLTRMFRDNVPSTVEDFWAMMPIIADKSSYEKGQIVDGKYDAIKTIGFNQWDEKWEVGAYDNAGGKTTSTSQIRNVNPIEVLPNTTYYGRFPSGTNVIMYVYCYDVFGAFIQRKVVNKAKFTIPANCKTINFSMTSAYGTTYKNDICINLSWNEYSMMDGAYKSYTSYVRDMLWLSNYFEGGIMRSCANVRDELRYNYDKRTWEAIIRVKSVKMKDLTWTTPTSTLLENSIFNAKIADIRPFQSSENETKYRQTILCSAYDVAKNTSMGASMTDKTIMRQGATYGVVVHDTTYKTIDEFVASIRDTDVINYELAEPIVIEINSIPSMDYDTADYGTEGLVATHSAPIAADIIYEPNALATIKQVPDLLKRVAQLEAALTQTLNINNEEYE